MKPLTKKQLANQAAHEKRIAARIEREQNESPAEFIETEFVVNLRHQKNCGGEGLGYKNVYFHACKMYEKILVENFGYTQHQIHAIKASIF